MDLSSVPASTCPFAMRCHTCSLDNLASSPALPPTFASQPHHTVHSPQPRHTTPQEAREAAAAASEAAEAAAKGKEAEERAKEAELEAMSVTELRKSMVFKARPLPDFSAPFRPDGAKASPATQSQVCALVQ